MKKIIPIFLLVFSVLNSSGQLDITSILVNACGDEQFSEIVEFETSAPVNISTLEGAYTFGGGGHSASDNWFTCQNATTAAAVAALNAQIRGCGNIIEPPGGIIPAGGRTFWVRSQNFNTAHPDVNYSDLGEDIYMIFGCVNDNGGAVFGNTGTPGISQKGFNIWISGTRIDSVRYDPAQLTIGTNAGNGDRVNFLPTWSDISQTSYVNYGCAPTEPVITTASSSGFDALTVCNGATITIDGTALYQGVGAPFQGWMVGASNTGTGTVANTSNPTTTFTATGAGLVELYYTGGVECLDGSRDTLTITVVDPISTPTITSTNNLYCSSNGSLSITSSAAGTWAETTGTGGSIISGQGTASITVNGPGTYEVTVTDPNNCGTGSLTSDPFVVGNGVEPDTLISSITGTDICFGAGATNTTTTFTANKNPTSTTTSIAYWTVNGTRNETHPLTLTSNSNSGTFIVRLVDSTECGVLSSVSRTITKHAQIGTGADTISFVNSGNFSVCRTGGAPLDITAVLTAKTAGTPFIWTAVGGQAFTTGGTDDNVITVSNSDTYQVSYTDPFGCGSSSADKTVTIEEDPTITITTTDTLICADDDLNIDAISTFGVNTIWYKTSITPGNEVMAASASNGASTYILSSGSPDIGNTAGDTETFFAVNTSTSCPSASSQITITVLPSFNSTPTLTADSIVCANSTGDTIRLYAPGINDPLLNNTLDWAGSTIDTMTTPLYTTGTDYQYYAIPGFGSISSYVVNINNQCAINKLSNTVTIQSGQIPSDITLTTNNNDSLSCLDEPFDLIINANSGTTPFSYTWYRNNTDLGIVNNTATSITDIPPSVGTYTYKVEVTNMCSTSTSDTDTVTVQPLPVFNVVIPNLTAGGDSGLCVNGTVTLQVQSNQAINHNAHLWSTGYQGPDPITVARSGTYYVIVYDTNTAHVCADTNSITILPCPALIYAPTSFTPNGDGINDEFYIIGVATLDIVFTVYNRWGVQVYKTKNAPDGWDGTTENGEPAPQGAYVWYAQYYGDFDDSGVNYGTQMGTVTLIR